MKLSFGLSIFLASVALTTAWGAEGPANQLTGQEAAKGWQLLFDGTNTDGWRGFGKESFPKSGWKIEDGWFHCLGTDGGDIITKAEYDQFELEWDWKISSAGNSGVKYFVLDQGKSAIGHEYQMLDDDLNPDAKLADGKRVTASFYDVLAPEVHPVTKPLGEVNHSRILIKDNHVEHWLNGVKVLEYKCGSDAVKAAVARSKFKNVKGFENVTKGHILLQDHHSEVWFRNIKIRLARDA
jgi:hypothetical protein